MPLEHDGAPIGLISLGARRNGQDYTPQDHETLREIVEVVAHALSLTGRAE